MIGPWHHIPVVQFLLLFLCWKISTTKSFFKIAFCTFLPRDSPRNRKIESHQQILTRGYLSCFHSPCLETDVPHVLSDLDLPLSSGLLGACLIPAHQYSPRITATAPKGGVSHFRLGSEGSRWVAAYNWYTFQPTSRGVQEIV